MSAFCCPHHREPVRKARTKAKFKASKSYYKIEALSKQMGKAVQIHLTKGIRTFRNEVHPAALETAVRTGSYGQIMATIPWDKFPDQLKGYEDDMTKTYQKSTDFTIAALPAPIQANLRFDIMNPRLRKFIKAHTGERIVGIHKDTQIIVQRAVQRSFTRAYTPRKVANQIRDSIGLDPRREQALTSYRDGLEADGRHDFDQIDRLCDRYAERLLTSRTTIGRSETRQASSQGQLSVWREASNQGLINKATAQKVRIVDGNPCEICEPMDGVGVPLDEFWMLDNGDSVDIPADSHPNCLCGMDLDFGDADNGEGEDDEESAA